MSSPVINFLITYTRFESHGEYLNPCNHIEHDILFHGYNTHLQIYKMFYTKQEPNLIIHENFNIYAENIKELYSNIISNFFNEVIKLILTKEEKEKEKEYKGYFLIFHEYDALRTLIDPQFLIYLDKYKTNTNLYKKILGDYNKIVFNHYVEMFQCKASSLPSKLAKYCIDNPYPEEINPID